MRIRILEISSSQNFVRFSFVRRFSRFVRLPLHLPRVRVPVRQRCETKFWQGTYRSRTVGVCIQERIGVEVYAWIAL